MAREDGCELSASESSDNLARVVTMMMEHMLHERHNTTWLDKSIEKIVDALNGRINGNDVT